MGRRNLMSPDYIPPPEGMFYDDLEAALHLKDEYGVGLDEGFEYVMKDLDRGLYWIADDFYRKVEK